MAFERKETREFRCFRLDHRINHSLKGQHNLAQDFDVRLRRELSRTLSRTANDVGVSPWVNETGVKFVRAIRFNSTKSYHYFGRKKKFCIRWKMKSRNSQPAAAIVYPHLFSE